MAGSGAPGAALRGEGVQVSEGCGVGEGRMGRDPLEPLSKNKTQSPPGWCEGKPEQGTWRSSPQCLRQMTMFV